MPNGIKSWYSLQQNPRRPEILSPDPLGSILAAWASLIADPTTVRSFKLDGTGLTLVPGAGLTVTWTMSIPWDAPALGSAVNSAGIKAVRADTGAALAPFESAKAIIQALAPTGQLYGDKVWNDANSDGLQSIGETGINGVTVQLFRDNGDGQPDPATDTLVDTTLTADINGQAGIYRFGHFPPGGYFAAVAPPSDNWSFATADAGANDSLDSDPVIIIRNGGRRGLMPVTQITAGEQDLTWDAGLSDRSGSPAVWAIAQPATDKYLIGGRFTQSRGVARKNIALLTAAGTVDTAFNPGAGFDNTVRSLAVRSDGMIIAGGNFVTYNGAVSKGIALLTSAGVWSGPAAQPDTADVNWVAASGTGIYLGGAFSKVGSTPAGNVARLNAFGGVDTNFATGTGANGPVYGGAVLSTGDILLVGGFTQFNGSARRGIVQLGSDGHVVSAFDPGAGASGEVYALKVFDDGRMLLTGNFRSFAGTPCNGTIRLDPQGKVDTTLSPSSLNVQTINSAN